MSFWEEVRRRKVVRVAVAYSVVAWILVEIAVTVKEPLGLPDWLDTLVIVLVAVGFPLALILSWAYDLTLAGIERTKDIESSDETAEKTTADLIHGQASPPILLTHSLAVLPFANMSDDPEQEYFSDGLTEDIITDLSLYSGIIRNRSQFYFQLQG